MSAALPPTEGIDPQTTGIDGLSTGDLARLLVAGQRGALDAVAAVTGDLARAIDAVASAFVNGGRVRALGAGTSGRLAVLDAAELPPTFGVDPERIDARIAGGDAALRQAVEGAEDDAAAGVAAVDGFDARDVVIGLSASGGAPYVCAALRAARANGVLTIALVNAPQSPLLAEATIGIVLATGAEPIAGSTRMKAGTAQKIALNTISTGAMIRAGKTYRNLMVDVRASNEKLRARAERLVRSIAGDVDAPTLLAQAGGRVKPAIVMARCACTFAEAEAKLAAVGGHLAAVIDPS